MSGIASVRLWLRRRRPSDLLLFGVTLAELGILVYLTPTFTITDWIYILQHVVALGIALTRPAPEAQNRSPLSNSAVAMSYAYPYAEIIWLRWRPGDEAWPDAGLALVTLAAALSLASLITLGRFFGIRPAMRGLAIRGPYSAIRHPMYLAYMISDVGYNFQEWNTGTALLTLAGWVSLLYRIHAEEKVLSAHSGWTTYTSSVRYRLIPGLW
ncbi:MAG TPA: isoprenylcysteine carboxylmethyltransferase family protein [Terriglobia bacterium]|nr:isoprenylcysteine carboxylmethyltransferase family protein [Terriglobia bacterium]